MPKPQLNTHLISQKGIFKENNCPKRNSLPFSQPLYIFLTTKKKMCVQNHFFEIHAYLNID